MGQAPGRLQTILPWRVRSPNLACKLRPRHAARVQRPYGQTPEAIRPDTEGEERPYGQTPRTRTRTHEKPGPCSHTGPAHSRNQISRTPGRDPVRTQARHIHATKSLELIRDYSRRRFPSHVPGVWFRGRFPEHEWEISFPSCHPCMTRRPFPGPDY